MTPLHPSPSPPSPCLKNAQNATIHGTPAPASSPSWAQVGPKSLLGGGLGPKCSWEGSWGRLGARGDLRAPLGRGLEARWGVSWGPQGPPQAPMGPAGRGPSRQFWHDFQILHWDVAKYWGCDKYRGCDKYKDVESSFFFMISHVCHERAKEGTIFNETGTIRQSF